MGKIVNKNKPRKKEKRKKNVKNFYNRFLL